MIYKAVYTLVADADLRKYLTFPIELSIDNRRICIQQSGADGRALATVEGKVDLNALRLADREAGPFQELRPAGIEVPEEAEFRYRLANVTNAITFLTDVAIRISQRPQDGTLIVEGDDDRKRLDELGTSEPDRTVQSWASVRSFVAKAVEQVGWNALLEKESGLALYTRAVLQKEPIGRYRELWSVVESAFGLQDDKLIAALMEFPITAKMKFDKIELQRLHRLRGRASHASSRLGVEELRAVSSECADQVHRVKSLAEILLLMKKTWGSRGNAVEQIAPITGYVLGHNKIVLFRRAKMDST